MTPVAFEGLSATLHPASARRGLLVVGSAGFEDLCAHRFLVALADESARLGVPALRIDLRGFGDSAPAVLDETLAARWVDDLVMAAEWMRRELRCTEVAVAGLRLGALLASAAQGVGADFSRVALLAPPSSGKAYLRELKIFARVVAAPPTAPGLDGIDLAGYHMPADLLRGIEKLDWSGSGKATPCDVLVCGHEPPALSDNLRAGGQAVSTSAFDGYDRLMCDPTASVVPGAVVRHVALWCAQGALPGTRRTASVWSSDVRSDGWIEEGVAFGPDDRLNGILCHGTGPQNGPLVIFTNPGGIRRTGWGNMWVDMARDLARGGIASLRFDFSNLIADLDENEPAFHYGEHIWAEVTAVVDLADARGYGAIIAVGACSGAFHVLRAANFDLRIEGAVLVNQLCYDWSSAHGVPLNAWMKQKAGDFDRKRRALDDDVSELSRLQAQLMVRGIGLVKVSAKTALRQIRTLAALLPTGAQDGTAATAHSVREIVERGCRIDVVQAEGDPSIAEYDRSVGLDPKALDGLSRVIVPGADHLMTPRTARATLLARIKATADAFGEREQRAIANH